MTEVRCGFTSCKNNIAKGDGYFCKCKKISIIYHWSSSIRVDEMMCEQMNIKKGYAR